MLQHKKVGQQNECRMGISVLKFSLLWLIALTQMALETKPQCCEKAGQAFCIWMELESRATRHPSFCNLPHMIDL